MYPEEDAVGVEWAKCALDGEGRAELRPHRLANRAVGYTHAPMTFAYFLGS